MTSIFTDRNITPTEQDLKKALGKTYDTWQKLAGFTKRSDPSVTGVWNYTNEKYGWSFRIKDKKRVILYLLPRDKCFKVALVFGEKATGKILETDIAESLRSALKKAKVYAEGRGIRINVTDDSITRDIMKMISVKISG